jgi:hypothetical protein
MVYYNKATVIHQSRCLYAPKTDTTWRIAEIWYGAKKSVTLVCESNPSLKPMTIERQGFQALIEEGRLQFI